MWQAQKTRGEGWGRKARKGKGRGSPFPSSPNPLPLFRGSQWSGGIYGYRLKFWLFYGYRLIFFQLRLTMKLKINFFVSKS